MMKDVLTAIVPLTLMLCVFLYGYLADPLKLNQITADRPGAKKIAKN